MSTQFCSLPNGIEGSFKFTGPSNHSDQKMGIMECQLIRLLSYGFLSEIWVNLMDANWLGIKYQLDSKLAIKSSKPFKSCIAG